MTAQRTQLPDEREQFVDRQDNTVQTNMRRIAMAVNQRGGPPIVHGPFTFTAGGQVRIEHKLLRQPVEWPAIDVTGGYGVFQRISWDDKAIVIQSQNACTATFRIS